MEKFNVLEIQRRRNLTSLDLVNNSRNGRSFSLDRRQSVRCRKMILLTVVAHVLLTNVAADRYPEGWRREDGGGDPPELPDTGLQVDDYRTRLPSSPNDVVVGSRQAYPVLTTNSPPPVLPMTVFTRNRYVRNVQLYER